MAEINVTKLDGELKAAGIPIHGCSSDGRIDFKDEATQAQRAQALSLLTQHDPAPTALEKLAKIGRDKFVAKLLVRMSSHFSNIDPVEAKKIQDEIDSEADYIAGLIGISLGSGHRP